MIAVDAEPGEARGGRDRSARRDGVLWAGSAEETAEAVREVSGGGVDYAIEATGRPEAMLAAFLSTRAAGRGRADRHPARGRRAAAAGALDPAHGAAGARLDLRLVAARARLPADARPLPQRAACRSTGSSRTGCRSTRSSEAFELMRSGEALRVVLDLTDLAGGAR